MAHSGRLADNELYQTRRAAEEEMAGTGRASTPWKLIGVGTRITADLVPDYTPSRTLLECDGPTVTTRTQDGLSHADNPEREWFTSNAVPNPATQWVRFTVPHDVVDATLEIYNTNGQRILLQKG